MVAMLSAVTAAGGAARLFTPASVDRNGTTMVRTVGRAVKDPTPVLVAEHPWERSLQFFHSVLEIPAGEGVGEVWLYYSSWTEEGAFISLAKSTDHGKT